MSVVIKLKPKVYTSRMKTTIAIKDKNIIDRALRRMELLHAYQMREWGPDHMDLLINGDSQIEFAIDITKTSLKSQAELDIYLQKLKAECDKLMQEDFYEKVLKNAETKGLKLEREWIDEDETIVLTYQIP